MELGHKIIFFFLFITACGKYSIQKEYDFKPRSQNSEALPSLEQQRGFTVPSNIYNGYPKERYDPFPVPAEVRVPSSSEETEAHPPSYGPDPNSPTRPMHSYPLSFRFSDVGLQRIGQNFIQSDSIISLSLDNNNISDISPFAFRSMKNLRHLNLSGNRIPIEKLLSLSGNNNLQTLIINNNYNDFDISHKSNIIKILKEYESFQSLEHLHLCNDQLEDIQVPFYIAMPTLTHLHLSNNSISSSSSIFDNLSTTLTHLNLKKNLIDRVEHDKLRYLQELVMNDNKITQVCYEECQAKSISLRGAFRMQKLSLSRNQISEVSHDAFNDTERLLDLDLSGNEIANLAEDTFNYTARIINLSLAYNILGTIPNVCPILNLRSLNLTGNRISTVFSDTFCHLRLSHLYLSNNRITVVETRAFNLQSLIYLDLSGNQLRQLPAQWISPWPIQDLHLERNHFTELNNLSLMNIKTLSNVHLDENPMLKLKAEYFQSLPGHVTLHLKNIRVNATQIKCAQCQCDNGYDDDDNDNDEDNNGNW